MNNQPILEHGAQRHLLSEMNRKLEPETWLSRLLGDRLFRLMAAVCVIALGVFGAAWLAHGQSAQPRPPKPIFAIRGLQTGVEIPARDLVLRILMDVCKQHGGELESWTIAANLDGRDSLDTAWVCRRADTEPKGQGA